MFLSSPPKTRPGLCCHEADRNACLEHVLLDLGYAVLAEMEDARGEHRASASVHGGDHMFGAPGTAGRDYGERRLLRDGGDEIEVVTALGPIGVHAVQHELSGPPPLPLDEPPDGIHPRVYPSAVQVDLPARGPDAPLDVHAEHDALAPETFGALRNQVVVPDRSAVYGDLVGAGAEHGSHIG